MTNLKCKTNSNDWSEPSYARKRGPYAKDKPKRSERLTIRVTPECIRDIELSIALVEGFTVPADVVEHCVARFHSSIEQLPPSRPKKLIEVNINKFVITDWFRKWF
jgi:hypothetical protein